MKSVKIAYKRMRAAEVPTTEWIQTRVDMLHGARIYYINEQQLASFKN